MIYNSSLANVISSLPGIFDVIIAKNNPYKEEEPIKIFFNVSSNDNTGLFFLTRCCDTRYWKYGYFWKIELSVSDSFVNNHLPITYILHSGHIVGADAHKQALNLIENMNWHLDNDAFMRGYNLKKEIFIKKYISNQRRNKLNSLNNKR